MTSPEHELAVLLALLRRKPGGAGWNEIAACVAAAGSALEVRNEFTEDALFSSPDSDAALKSAESDMSAWKAAGLRLVTVLDDDYPLRLLGIRETPPFLFYEGALADRDDGMSIVGSRSATRWGLEFAADAARFLVSEKLTVIAGLAEGIDTAAHQAALEAGGRTVAFLGTGITRSYPASNTTLQRTIAERGLLLSQFYPDAPPTKQSFPMRNATMSGYGLATIVVEAGEHSGTRIQARVAGEHGRPVILTARVADSTSWGDALRTRPNVYVVGSLAELTDAVKDVREAPARLRSALNDLVSS
jgi:DNA processing protein